MTDDQPLGHRSYLTRRCADVGLRVSLPVVTLAGPLRLTPTDGSQFVLLDQCERFLRFRPAEWAGQKFMEEYDVNPLRIARWAVRVVWGGKEPDDATVRFRRSDLTAFIYRPVAGRRL